MGNGDGLMRVRVRTDRAPNWADVDLPTLMLLIMTANPGYNKTEVFIVEVRG